MSCWGRGLDLEKKQVQGRHIRKFHVFLLKGSFDSLENRLETDTNTINTNNQLYTQQNMAYFQSFIRKVEIGIVPDRL